MRRTNISIVLLALVGSALCAATAEAATERPLIYAKTYGKWVGTREEPELREWGGLYAARNGRPQRLTDHAGDDEPDVSADGAMVAFVRKGDIFLIKADGSWERQLTRGPTLDQAPQISPDGRYILFTRRAAPERPQDLYRVGLDGGVRALASLPGEEHEASISPDGKVIVFVRGLPRPGIRNKNFELFSIRPSGSGLRRLTRTENDELAPSYFARGIVFERRRRPSGGSTSIYSMRRDGGRVRHVVVRPEAQLEAVSPNGRLLVYSTLRFRSRGVWRKRMAGPGSARPRRLTRWTTWHKAPVVFSPDGRRVAAVFTEYSWSFELASIDVQTGARQNEGESWVAEEDSGPVWAEIGRGLTW